MLKLLWIVSFTMLGTMAAFALPTPADNESIDNMQQPIQDRGCGCGKDKTKK